MVTGMTTWDTFDQRLTKRRRGIVEGLLEFVRHNTVSQNPQGVRTGGEWLAALMRRRGLEVRVLETGGGPAVFGERPTPGATRTVLIYCHYDTKPAPAKEWFQPSPFEPVFRNVGDAVDVPCVSFDRVPTETLTDWRVYARGASDDKGPIWSHLEALALLDELGLSPRVNLKFIFDGEEEIGSPFFGPLVEKHKDLLAADLVLVTDGPKHASGRPTIAFGARGVLKLEGFEEDVAPPTQAERELMGRFPLDLPALERELGVRLPQDYLDKIMFHPTLTIRGLQSGFVGAEANTIIPHKTTVALDIRIVKNQKIETVYRRILDHIRAQGFEVIEGPDAPLPDHLRGRAVRVSDKGGYDPAKTPADLPICAEVVAAVERAHGGQQAVVMPTMGGSVPIWAFTDILRLPTILVPYANANNRQHSPNEHLRLDHLFQGVRTTAGLLRELGG